MYITIIPATKTIDRKTSIAANGPLQKVPIPSLSAKNLLWFDFQKVLDFPNFIENTNAQMIIIGRRFEFQSFK